MSARRSVGQRSVRAVPQVERGGRGPCLSARVQVGFQGQRRVRRERAKRAREEGFSVKLWHVVGAESGGIKAGTDDFISDLIECLDLSGGEE